MIFLTVGTQLPFDRLVAAMDSWAENNAGNEVVAQVGDSHMKPMNMKWSKFMEAGEFRECFNAADIIVAHAGMGTILTGLDLGKPVIVVPRLASHGEHRNDHQLATVDKLQHLPLVHPVHDLTRLGHALGELDSPAQGAQPGNTVSASLLKAIREFVATDVTPPWHYAT